jgi:glycosyltransferase involved in cell wall biosynthesis
MRILFVALANSMHTARWIRQISRQGWDIHLFSADGSPAHPDLAGISSYNVPAPRRARAEWQVYWQMLQDTLQLKERLRAGLRAYAPGWLQPEPEPAPALSRIVQHLQPDLVHVLGIQHGGYLTLEARRQHRGDFPRLVLSPWGSDLYLYSRLREHVERIRAVLAGCDYLIPECERDVRIARELGFQGVVLSKQQASGSFDVRGAQQFRSSGPSSARRVVALKGYQNWAGRALTGLRALELCADQLGEYQIVVYLASPDVRLAVELLQGRTGLHLEVLPYSNLETILCLHGRARISIGLSISDGMPASLWEAMAMGAFPIQSDTCCADEWIRDGETVLLVPPDDPDAVAAALQRALSDDRLVDQAASRNEAIAVERMQDERARARVVALYQEIAGHSQRSAEEREQHSL